MCRATFTEPQALQTWLVSSKDSESCLWMNSMSVFENFEEEKRSLRKSTSCRNEKLKIVIEGYSCRRWNFESQKRRVVIPETCSSNIQGWAELCAYASEFLTIVLRHSLGCLLCWLAGSLQCNIPGRRTLQTLSPLFNPALHTSTAQLFFTLGSGNQRHKH